MVSVRVSRTLPLAALIRVTRILFVVVLPFREMVLVSGTFAIILLSSSVSDNNSKGWGKAVKEWETGSTRDSFRLGQMVNLPNTSRTIDSSMVRYI